MRPLLLFGSSVLIVVVLLSAVAFINTTDDKPEKHVEVVFREIGHQLLSAANDSTSRVMPVRQLDENTWQISFQHKVGFISDSLINIVQRTFQKNAPATDYIVNLRNCEQKETVLAFEINGKTGDLIPCRGRRLEYGCYVIEIDLLRGNRLNPLWYLLLLIPLGVAGYYLKDRFRKKQADEPVSESTDHLPLGRYRFYEANNLLKTGNKTISLTENETKALSLFAKNMNQVMEREKLMKEIWEDRGLVVISRNVDVLVSKLRKKLADDSTIKIINVPGRGYKFVVE